MQNLFRYSSALVSNTDLTFTRYLIDRIGWDDQLIGITGARGIGKTTLMLQRIKKSFGNTPEALYISLDNFYFLSKNLFDLAEEFVMNGGKYLFVDEVHRYPTWATEMKNIYDTFPKLKVIFSGSSALQIHKAEADLSRRASLYKLVAMSFREHIEITTGKKFDNYSFNDLILNHIDIATQIVEQIKPIVLFKEYILGGSYPFYHESPEMFQQKLISTVNTILENDLPAIEHFTYSTIVNTKKVLALIADSVPFKPNITELGRKTGISRDVLLRIIDLLEKSGLLLLVRQNSIPTGYLTKPEKIYLNNTSLLYGLTLNQSPEIGTLRETFFANQLMENHLVNTSTKGDFLIDNKYVFEVGGRNKKSAQITGVADSYLVQDDIEIGYKNIIPLWLFGFLY